MKFLITCFFSTICFLLCAQETKIEALFFKCQYSEVIEEANKKITSAKACYETWYYKGLSEKALFKYNKAEKSFDKALSLKPNNIELMLILANIYKHQGNLQKSADSYRKILKTDSTNISAMSNLALIYRKEKEYTKAVSLLSELVKQDTTNSYFYSQLAYCTSKIGLNEPAINYYKKAIEFSPNNYNSSKALVNIEITQKHYDLATQYIDTFLLIFKNDLYLLKQKAYVSAINGRYLDAVSEFNRVTELGDSSLFTCKYYGQSLYNNGDFNESVFWLNKYLKQNPDDFQNQLIMGLACQQDYQYEKSLNHLNKALVIKHNPKIIARIFNEKAKTEIKYGDYKGFRDSVTHSIKLYKSAKNNYLKALEVYPEGWQVYSSLGTLYETKFKDPKLALYYFEKYYKEMNTKQVNEIHLDWIQKKIRSLKEELHFKVKG